MRKGFGVVVESCHNIPTYLAFQYLIDVLSSSLDKTSIRQLQVAVEHSEKSYVKNRAYLTSSFVLDAITL